MLFLSLTARLAIIAVAVVAAATLLGTLSWIDRRDRSKAGGKPAAKDPRPVPFPKAA